MRGRQFDAGKAMPKGGDLPPLQISQCGCGSLLEAYHPQEQPEMPLRAFSLDFSIVDMGGGNQRVRMEICGVLPDGLRGFFGMCGCHTHHNKQGLLICGLIPTGKHYVGRPYPGAESSVLAEILRHAYKSLR